MYECMNNNQFRHGYIKDDNPFNNKPFFSSICKFVPPYLFYLKLYETGFFFCSIVGWPINLRFEHDKNSLFKVYTLNYAFLFMPVTLNYNMCYHARIREKSINKFLVSFWQIFKHPTV